LQILREHCKNCTEWREPPGGELPGLTSAGALVLARAPLAGLCALGLSGGLALRVAARLALPSRRLALVVGAVRPLALVACRP